MSDKLGFFEPSKEQLKELAEAAWRVRKNAWILGKTKVGAALLSESGAIFVGCNVEQYYRSHDVHAEVNAIGNMVAAGERRFVAVVIAAECQKFTPCGACLDWVFQFGGPDCVVGFQRMPESEIEVYRARELMPHYPVK